MRHPAQRAIGGWVMLGLVFKWFPFWEFSLFDTPWHPTPVLLPGKSHGQKNLVGCSPWGHKKSDTTERLHFHFSLSCIGEGNGNPLQCSCLENPRDGRAWWAAIYGLAQSQTWLKRLSSSNSRVSSLVVLDLGISVPTPKAQAWSLVRNEDSTSGLLWY